MENKVGRWSDILAAAVLFSMFLILAGSSLDNCLTVDEYPHIEAGYAYVKKFSLHQNPEHPPLMKILSGIPLLFLQIKGKNPLKNYNDQEQVLFAARLPNMFLALLLGIVIYLWVSKLSNKSWGIFCLFLFAFEPTILAHSTLATTDLASTTFMFCAIYCLSNLLIRFDSVLYFSLILSVSAALLTKFSGIVLIPFIICIWSGHFLYYKFRSFKKNVSPFEFDFKKLRLFFTAVFIIVVSVYIIFMFNYTLRRQIKDVKRANYYPLFQQERLLKFLQYPFARFPGHYLYGILFQVGHVAKGHEYPQYLMGHYSRTGWWYYFIIAFLVKTPGSLLILLAFALFHFFIKEIGELMSGIRNYYELPFKEKLVCTSQVNMIAFMFLFGFICLRSKLNIGVRHILPIYPFFLAFIGLNFYRLFESIKAYRDYMYTFIMSLLIGLAIYLYGTYAIYPHYLSYFNEFVGPRHGYKYLSDSNLDWGQDLKRLAVWVEGNDIKKIKIDYWGRANVRYYLGKNYEQWGAHKGLPKKGYFAVSIFYILLNSDYFKKGKVAHSYDALLKRKPFARIGYSIYVYKMD
ncbi:phospholipid carrier-dependent glycosyltransferase [Candidatus Riflebacteria bacterium]